MKPFKGLQLFYLTTELITLKPCFAISVLNTYSDKMVVIKQESTVYFERSDSPSKPLKKHWSHIHILNHVWLLLNINKLINNVMCSRSYN